VLNFINAIEKTTKDEPDGRPLPIVAAVPKRRDSENPRAAVRRPTQGWQPRQRVTRVFLSC
jgi:hypothetical protein